MKVVIIAVEGPEVQNETRCRNGVDALYSSIETIRRNIADDEDRIRKLEKRIAERQQDCRHSLAQAKDEEYLVFDNGGSQKLLVHKNRMVQARCTECSIAQSVKIYHNGIAACPKCFQKMVEDDTAPKLVLDLGERIGNSLGTFRCDVCDLLLLVYTSVY